MNRQDARGEKGAPQRVGGVRSGPGEAVDAVATAVLEAAVAVHRALGPGFMEGVYEEALDVELRFGGISFARQVPLSIAYRDHLVGEARLDLLVEDVLIVELKAVEHLAPVHVAQAMSYLRATGCPLALLINFNVPVLLRGVRRVISSLRPPP
jgi:GxxExxY protein